MHVWETGSQFGHVGPDQRIGHQVDMVGDDHQVARAERCIDAARGVRDEQEADAEQPHDADREGHLLHRIAFVVVEPSLHGHDAAAARLAENQTSLVPLDRRDGEAGNVLVIERMARLDPVGEIAQPRAEHDAHLGREISGRGPDERGGFLNFL